LDPREVDELEAAEPSLTRLAVTEDIVGKSMRYTVVRAAYENGGPRG